MENFYNQIRNIVSELGTKSKIVIVGKGDSVTEINKEVLEDAFIINVNDSEKYISGHFTIFYAPWILESLQEGGFKNKMYITNQALETLLPSSARSLYAPYEPLHNEGAEHLVAFFEKKEFVISDFLLMSAIKLASIINTFLSIKLPIYLVGFDFALTQNSEVIDVSGHDINYKTVLLKTQKEQFKFIRKGLKDRLQIKLIHVGSLELSDLSISQFNQSIALGSKENSTMKFDNILEYKQLLQRCQDEEYTIVVAELTNNHIGDANRLRAMIRKAKQDGADMIKVQKRDVDSFYTREELDMYYESPFGNTLESYRKGVELGSVLMQVLIDECQQNKIVWFASILDYPSLKFIKNYNSPLIKLPSTISNHKNFLRKVAEEYNGDLVISTGFTDQSYEEFILETFLGKRTLFLLQCTSSYPAPPESCQLSVVRHYEEMKIKHQTNSIHSGYSSHDLGSLGSMMAVAAGAKMIEKHVKYGNLEWIHFDGVALDLSNNEFEQFVKDIRKASLMCGSKLKKIHQEEHHKYIPNETHN